MKKVTPKFLQHLLRCKPAATPTAPLVRGKRLFRWLPRLGQTHIKARHPKHGFTEERQAVAFAERAKIRIKRHLDAMTS